MFHAWNTVSKSLHDQTIRTKTVGLRASDLHTIVHGVAEAVWLSARLSLATERNTAYMATPLLSLDAWLSQNIKKRTRNASSRPDWRVALHVGSDSSDRSIMKLGIGFTPETTEVVH